MAKTDYKRVLKHLYTSSVDTVVTIDVPTMMYLMVDGHGDPNTSQRYIDAVEALYVLSYALKFKFKREGADYIVMPLEGLWWSDDMATFTSARDKDAWSWTMMIMQPEPGAKVLIEEVRAEVAAKKNVAALADVRLEAFHEGWAVQILHLGPYDEEGPTVAKLHEAAERQGYTLRGKHHEIYLSDPRRTAPEKLKTLLRQPVVQA